MLNVYIIGWNYCLKSTPNDWPLGSFSWQFLVYTQGFCEKSAERKFLKKYFVSYLVLREMSDLRFWPVASNKSTHFLLDPSDNGVTSIKLRHTSSWSKNSLYHLFYCIGQVINSSWVWNLGTCMELSSVQWRFLICKLCLQVYINWITKTSRKQKVSVMEKLRK